MRTSLTMVLLLAATAAALLTLCGCTAHGQPVVLVAEPNELQVEVTVNRSLYVNTALVVVPGEGVLDLSDGQKEVHDAYGLWRTFHPNSNAVLEDHYLEESSFSFPLWNIHPWPGHVSGPIYVSASNEKPSHVPLRVRYRNAWIGELWLITLPFFAERVYGDLHTLDHMSFTDYGHVFVEKEVYDRIQEAALNAKRKREDWETSRIECVPEPQNIAIFESGDPSIERRLLRVAFEVDARKGIRFLGEVPKGVTARIVWPKTDAED